MSVEFFVSLRIGNNNNLNLETMMNMSNQKDSERPPPEGRKIEMGHCHCTETGPHIEMGVCHRAETVPNIEMGGVLLPRNNIKF